MAWHSQRPTNSYSETKIFDKYFDQLFRRKDYSPENMQALNMMFKSLYKKWNEDNGKEILDNLNKGLSMDKKNFEGRWSAD